MTWIRLIKYALLLVSLIVPFLMFAQVTSDRTPFQATQNQIDLFFGLSLFESLSFVTGAAFLIFGFPVAKRLIHGSTKSFLAYLCVVWLAISWLPHDFLHTTAFGQTVNGLLIIEYGFHVTSMVAIIVLILLFSTARDKGK